MNGIIIINKTEGFTSFDVVHKVRKILSIKKVGHTGTLDPMAVGVLPIMLGRATKVLDILPDNDKQYVAGLKLGITTDTLDITGKVLDERESNINCEKFKSILSKFVGDIEQFPPMYSAIKKDGRRLYELARKGKEIDREARKIHIEKLELISFNEKLQEAEILVDCSKGTYVRSLCDDIGKILGCGACMSALLRTKACGFSLEDSITLEELEESKIRNKISEKIINIDSLFICYKRINITAKQSIRFKNGNFISASRVFDLKNISYADGEIFRIYSDENVFLGLAKLSKENDKLTIFKLLYDTAI